MTTKIKQDEPILKYEFNEIIKLPKLRYGSVDYFLKPQHYTKM